MNSSKEEYYKIVSHKEDFKKPKEIFSQLDDEIHKNRCLKTPINKNHCDN